MIEERWPSIYDPAHNDVPFHLWDGLNCEQRQTLRDHPRLATDMLNRQREYARSWALDQVPVGESPAGWLTLHSDDLNWWAPLPVSRFGYRY